MKKTLLLIASAALLFAGCKKEQICKDAGDGEMTDVTFSVRVRGEEATKAAIDEDGKGIYADRCIMVLYYGDNVYGRYTAAVSDYSATFDVKLPAKRTYKAVFWADCAAENGGDLYYNTEDLKNITLTSAYVGNDDKRDAFFTAKDYTVEAQTNNAFTATLKRPFAQINVISKDIQALHLAELYPQKVNLSFEAAASFNAMSGECGAAGTISYEADVYKAYDSAKEQLTLSMDYLFAGSRSAVDIGFKAPTEGTMEIEYSFTNIPYERNYRTNIIGNLLTADAHWDVTINPAWEQPDEEVNYIEAGSIAAANEALKTNNSVSIENPSDLGTDIVIPAEQDGNDVYIKITGASAGDIVIKKAADGPAKLDIESDSKTLDIDLPGSHVNVNKGDYTAVTAKTSATTLVVGKDVKIGTLTINAGNAEIHGKVASLTRANSVKAAMYASDPVTLANYISWAKYGELVGLECDIDLNGVNWTPLCASSYFSATFDGQGHTISNLNVADYSGAYIGFISVISGATVKNVTFKDAVLTNASANEGARGGVIAGWSYACTIDNCHVINASVNGNQKVGGILGSMSVEGSDGLNSVTNCSVEKLTLSSNNEDKIYQSGALVGYIQLISANPNGILIGDNRVKDITINDDCGDCGNLGYYNGTFIGTISSKQKIDGQKIILNNNIISGTNTDVFKTVYSSPYFGWATNAENFSGAIAPILIDGVEWAPNYPVRNVTTGKGYASLDAAITALQENQTVEILQAGEYTVQSLSAPANTTIEAKEDGVVFNHAAGGYARITSDTNVNVTVKNVTWNVGVAGYQYYSGTNLENCKVTGSICLRTPSTFKNCEFYNADDYNFWEYGSGSTFVGCKFTCPGGTKGGAINAYNEGHQQDLKVVILEDCEFVALEQSGKYAAVYIKPETDFDVQFTDCTFNDNFCTGDKSGSKLWNVKSHDNLKTKVTVDGKLVYEKGTVLDITTVNQLLDFAAAVNAGNTFEGRTVYLGADIDLAGKTWIPAGNVVSYPSIGFFGTFEGQNHTIKNMTCSDSTPIYATAGFIGAGHCHIKDLTLENVNVSSTHYAGAFVGYASAGISLNNCTLKGGSVISTPELLGAEYDNGDKAGGLIGYSSNGCNVTNCTVDGVTVKAYRDLGGIAGAIGGAISNCIVRNSSIIQDNTNGYKDSVDTFHEILGRDLGATLTDNTIENVTVTSSN